MTGPSPCYSSDNQWLPAAIIQDLTRSNATKVCISILMCFKSKKTLNCMKPRVNSDPLPCPGSMPFFSFLKAGKDLITDLAVSSLVRLSDVRGKLSANSQRGISVYPSILTF